VACGGTTDRRKQFFLAVHLLPDSSYFEMWIPTASGLNSWTRRSIRFTLPSLNTYALLLQFTVAELALKASRGAGPTDLQNVPLWARMAS
jgi:hypothetical protein